MACAVVLTHVHLFLLLSTQWSCPTQTDSSSDVYIDYKIGARKSYSPMQGEDKTLTSILRNDKLLSYHVEPFAFAPNANHELCYGFGLSGPASLGPPFKLFANATKAAKTAHFQDNATRPGGLFAEAPEALSLSLPGSSWSVFPDITATVRYVS